MFSNHRSACRFVSAGAAIALGFCALRTLAEHSSEKQKP
jgi:hypothetical protein